MFPTNTDPFRIILTTFADVTMNDAEILAAYPDLEKGDIAESLRYAAGALR